MILKVANGSGIFKGHGWHIVKEIMVKFTFTIDSKKITYLKLTPPKKKGERSLQFGPKCFGSCHRINLTFKIFLGSLFLSKLGFK